MCKGIYLPLQCYREQFHCFKNHLCSAYLSLPFLSTKPLATTDLFTVSVVLPFPECHIVRIVQFVAFSDWLYCLNNIHLCFLNVFSWLHSLFLSLSNIPLSGYRIFFFLTTHQLKEIPLASKLWQLQINLLGFFFTHLDKCQEAKLLDHL